MSDHSDKGFSRLGEMDILVPSLMRPLDHMCQADTTGRGYCPKRAVISTHPYYLPMDSVLYPWLSFCLEHLEGKDRQQVRTTVADLLNNDLSWPVLMLTWQKVRYFGCIMYPVCVSPTLRSDDGVEHPALYRWVCSTKITKIRELDHHGDKRDRQGYYTREQARDHLTNQYIQGHFLKT